MNEPNRTDLATVADRSVADATAVPPDDLPDNPRAYLEWLRDPARPIRRPRPRTVQEEPAPTPYGPLEARDPAYATAATKLAKLPDLGGASIAAALEQLGKTASWEQLVIHAAAHPITPSGDQLEQPQRQTPTTTTPSCQVCGTALDPDGGCFTCATAAAKGVAS